MSAFKRIGFSLVAMLLSTSLAHAQTVESLGDLPGGGFDSRPTGVSGSGTVVVGGSSTAAAYFEAYRWELGSGMIGLGVPIGADATFAQGVSDDGSVVLVQADLPGTQEALLWTSGGGYISIGDLPGGVAQNNPWALSGDGLTAVGLSTSGNGFEAYYWNSGSGIIALGDLAGGFFFSSARGVNYDGSVIVGVSRSGSGNEAFYWTSGSGMVAMGDLAGGGFASTAYDVSNDGTIIVGFGQSVSGNEAFRWTSGGGMVGLGDLAGGGFFSQANAISGDGNVIVGMSEGTTGWYEAFRWTSGGGMESIQNLLTIAGVDMTNWSLETATGVDTDGDVIVGEGYFNGDYTSFLVNFAAGGGITTPQNLSADLYAATVPMQQAQAGLNGNVGQSLLAATQSLTLINSSVIDITQPQNIAPAAGGASERLWSVYTYGTLGLGQDNELGNRDASGTAGVALQVSDHLALGAGIIASGGKSDLSLGGESRFDAQGGSLIAAYEHPEGLRLYGTAFAAHVGVETDRHYRNGGGIDESQGDTDGIGYGGAVRAGWAIPLTQRTSIMPYAELQASTIKLDAYTETGGAFPAAFAEQEDTRTVAIYGAEVTHDFSSALQLIFRGGIGRRLGGDGDGLDVTTLGLNGTLNNEEGDRTWVQGSVGGEWAVMDSTHLSAEFTGRTHETQDPAGVFTLGLKINF